MPDPRALRIDVGPFHLAPTPDAATWTAAARAAGRAQARAAGGAQARTAGGAQTAGADASPGITATWGDWVSFAQKVLRADELWRAGEARGDAWDEGFAAARDAAAVNPYR